MVVARPRAIPCRAVSHETPDAIVTAQEVEPPHGKPRAHELDRLLASMEKLQASDLHLKAGSVPVVRIGGSCRHLELPPMSAEHVQTVCFEALAEGQRRAFEESGDLDFAYILPDGRRFRMNLYRERGCVALAARFVKSHIPTFEELYLPVLAMKRLSSLDQGLILLAGVTGSGKSTTIASMIEMINARSRCHIVTVEDPIEYVYTDKKAIIHQREVGFDTHDFRSAIRALMRQDPDVIVAGEMRDAETFDFALTAAETGHLVFGTLHASTVTQSFGRILDLFPPERHKQIRSGLHFNLKGIVCQKLLPSIKPGVLRVPAVEVMLSNPIIRKLVKEGEEAKVADVIEGGRDEGMQTFNQALCSMIQTGFIEEKVGMEVSPVPEQLRMLLQGFRLDEGRRIVG